ncbi:cyclin-domain-containing protein [Delphinella strobiligena]|nr:cyclin-domain-containing protein [Delphinella strobiligena]
MSDGSNSTQAGEHNAGPPPAPNPSTDSGLKSHDTDGSVQRVSDEGLVLESSDWDIHSVSSLSALMMLAHVVQSLSFITGKVPPTPPLTRPPTPKATTSNAEGFAPPCSAQPVVSPLSPASPSSAPVHYFPSMTMGSPEAQRDETMPTIEEVGAHAHADAIAIQYAAIARRFFLRSTPTFSLSEYLVRLHKYCPHSPGVYLTAAAWLHRLCVTETLVPATPRTIHRLCLASIRVASKSLEDNKWPQERIAKVGGIALHELTRIEVSLCFLLNFNLFVCAEELQQRMWQLQQTTRQGLSMRKRLSDGFRMKLPSKLTRVEQISAA